MSLSQDFKRRLEYSEGEMEKAGLRDNGLVHVSLRRIGIPVPPLPYCSFILNFFIAGSYWFAVMGTLAIVFTLISVRNLDVIVAAGPVLQSFALWFGSGLFGVAAGALSAYQRWRYKLTRWDAI